MNQHRYKKYNSTIRALSIGTVIISLILSIGFLYLTYQRAQRRIRKAQRNATLAAKAVCSTILSDSTAGTLARGLLQGTENGQRIEQGCRDILVMDTDADL